MRKLMWFTVGFAVAAIFGAYLFAPAIFSVAAVICVLLLVVSVALTSRFPKVKFVTVILIGLIVGFHGQMVYDSIYLSTTRKFDGKNGEFTVHATDYSQKTDYGGVVEGRIELAGKSYKIRAYLPEDTTLSPGDCISGYFTLKCTLPGCTRDSSYYRSDGVFLIAYPGATHTVIEADSTPWYGYPAVVRRQITNMIETTFPADATAFARALLLGDTETLEYETDAAFKISGIRHIIAVSGLHVTILFSLVFLLTGKRKVFASIIGIPVLLFFAAIAGFSPSIVRACVMHGLMSIGFLLKKEYDPPTALSFAVVMMLLANPWTASNVGFQLSVGCIIGILLFAQPIQNWMLDKNRLGKFDGFAGKALRWVSMSVSVSLAATLVTTPLCALYFGMVSLVSVLTNLLTLWIISFIFYGIVLSCVLGAIWLPLATVTAWLVAIPMRYVILVARGLSRFPLAAVYMNSIYMVLWLVVCYVLLAIFSLGKKKRPLVLVCCCFLSLCVALFASWTEPLQDECRVTVLDVGQGQCILLQSEGKSFLVDCGGDSDTAAADEAAALLLSQGIFRLDGLILTHYDADHAAGAVHLLTRVSADCVYLPECMDTDGYRDAIVSLAGDNVPIVTQDILLSYGCSTISLIPSEFGMTDNESGLCVLFQTENYDILITGDRGFSGEAELLRHMELPELELLIVGHHGSKYSTGEALLAAASPEVAIISVSADNRYGHPSDEVLARLEGYGCVIYRTDRDGTVVFRG